MKQFAWTCKDMRRLQFAQPISDYCFYWGCCYLQTEMCTMLKESLVVIYKIFFIGDHKCYDLQKDVSCIIFMYMADCLHPIHAAPSCWAMTRCIAASSMLKFTSLLFICYHANEQSTRHKPWDSFTSLVWASPCFSNGGRQVWFFSLLLSHHVHAPFSSGVLTSYWMLHSASTHCISCTTAVHLVRPQWTLLFHCY